MIAARAEPAANWDCGKGILVFFCLAIILVLSVGAYFLLEPQWDKQTIFDRQRIDKIISNSVLHKLKVDTPVCGWTANLSTCPSPHAQKHTGCTTGCTDPDSCGLNVTVSWKDVPISKSRQRIYLLASADCKRWWQAGFAHFIRKIPLMDIAHPQANFANREDNPNDNSGDTPVEVASGETRITDGCFGETSRQLVLAACLSEHPDDKIKNEVMAKGFPFWRCAAIHGACVSLDNVFVKDLPCCLPSGVWNPYES